MSDSKAVGSELVLHPSLSWMLNKHKDALAIAKKEHSLTQQGSDKVAKSEASVKEVNDFLQAVQRLVAEDDRVNIVQLTESAEFSKTLLLLDPTAIENLRTCRNFKKTSSRERKKVTSNLDKSFTIIFYVLTIVCLIVCFLTPNHSGNFYAIVFLKTFMFLAATVMNFLIADLILESYGDEFRLIHLDEKIEKLEKHLSELSEGTHTSRWLIANFPHGGLGVLHQNLEIHKRKKVEVFYRESPRVCFTPADAFASKLVELINKDSWAWNALASDSLKWEICIYSSVNDKRYDSSELSSTMLGFDTAHIRKLFNSMSFVLMRLYDNSNVLFAVSDRKLPEDKVAPIAGYTAEEVSEYLTWAAIKENSDNEEAEKGKSNAS